MSSLSPDIYCPYRVSGLVISTTSQIACICKELTFLISYFCPRCNLFRSTKSLLVRKKTFGCKLKSIFYPCGQPKYLFCLSYYSSSKLYQHYSLKRCCISSKMFRIFFLFFIIFFKFIFYIYIAFMIYKYCMQQFEFLDFRHNLSFCFLSQTEFGPILSY